MKLILQAFCILVKSIHFKNMAKPATKLIKTQLPDVFSTCMNSFDTKR